AALTPAVLCAEPRSLAAELPVRVGRAAWPAAVHDDPERALHGATVRDTRLVLVGGSSFSWVLQAVRVLRRGGGYPLAVVATATTPEEDLVLLAAGASIVVEPQAGPAELVTRLVALCRDAPGDGAPQVRWLQAEEMRMDLGARRCTLDGQQVELSGTEFDLLAFLMSRPQQAVPREEILRQVWGWRHGDGANTLRIQVGRLRRKLGDDHTAPRWIRSVRGIGYTFLPAVAELGEDRSDERQRQLIAVLNAQADALHALVDALGAASTTTAVAEVVVQWAVTRGFSDAATVFRLEMSTPGRGTSHLVASAGMSARWRQAVATGHPVSEGFMGSQVYASGDVVQLADMARLGKRYPVTARMSTAEDLHACLLVPLHAGGRIWGDLAFVSRTARAFTPARTAFLRTVAGVVQLAVAAAWADQRGALGEEAAHA
ncbi:MAG: GAF domain-containing protein, partial [Cellulomonadaceae bacterium]|nr:GAF domain-containing protein [Cellulomonadaceae bacterium]